MKLISQAQHLLGQTKGQKLSEEERCERAVELAVLLLEASDRALTPSERGEQMLLGRMLRDRPGRAFLTDLTDQAFRSHDRKRVADQVQHLIRTYGIPQFLSSSDQLKLELLKASPQMAFLLTHKVRQAMHGVILPGEERPLRRHLLKRQKEGVRTNLNHLGEAILGDKEARRRLAIYLEHLSHPEVKYVSVKITSICSQLNHLSWPVTLARLADPLRKLYRYANREGKFINLDMEEYHDLHLTVDLFRSVLDEEEFFEIPAGIVLQAYLPDSHPIQQELTSWARERVSQGGAPIKIRIVRGANLAMERVIGSIQGWEQAPYTTKKETDANFKLMLAYALQPANARAVHVGIATHNLFDIAYALLLAAENGTETLATFEMLEGMCDHQRRTVQQLAHELLLYCPASTREEFPHAISYLIRRLDENTAPENFLTHLPTLKLGTEEWETQVAAFTDACKSIHAVSSAPRRTQNRLVKPVHLPADAPFSNEPDTDWSRPHNRRWAEQIIATWKEISLPDVPLMIAGKVIPPGKLKGEGFDPSRTEQPAYHYALANREDVKRALRRAEEGAIRWSHRSIQERSAILAQVAHTLRQARGDLIGAMIADGGKLIPQADVEVSEAIDFVEYYRREAERLQADPSIDCKAIGTVLVTPPWNFPCSIPVGGVSAALAAGNSVLFKPAPEAVFVGWQLAQLFWNAGVPRSALQFLSCKEETVGDSLLKSEAVDGVILTGATATALHFYQLRPSLNLMAETGGKNTLVVSNLADRDLAIQDAITSAFGHAGQKCSACSLLILHAELYDDPSFLATLADAAATLRVGSAWDLATDLNPLIRAPGPDLVRALTKLDEGETWLLEPNQYPHNPNLWSPGIKLGVKPNSYAHQTEFFGPVLGVMRAESFDEAIELANGTPYGLTAGLHTLDTREMALWRSRMEAGNLYINRTITGAIVRRQPFGGCKASGFGPGAKAGGPNYLPQLMHIRQRQLPNEKAKLPTAIAELANLIEGEEERELFLRSAQSYVHWSALLKAATDPSKILGQENLLTCVPRGKVTLRVQKGDRAIDILRVVAAARICKTPLDISWEMRKKGPDEVQEVLQQLAVESDAAFCARVAEGKVARVRLLKAPSKALTMAAAERGVYLAQQPVLASGRYELLHYLREVATSITTHRYGNLPLKQADVERIEP
jgi:RHH-type transcriptional regulator, proline utilization regulon repressor / proline dehydrogenase / delta 1-pyrroline-5-carboxylate dehydrogenase